MKGISEFTVYQIKDWECHVQTIDGWKPARPLGRVGIMYRFRKAWKVFTGKADVLVWPRQ